MSFLPVDHNLDLSDLFDAATFRAAAANLVYVGLHFICGKIMIGWRNVVSMKLRCQAKR